jgi:hypothetical protein
MRADAHNGHRLPFETESKPLMTVAHAAQSASTVHLVSVDYFSHGPLRPWATVNKFVPHPAIGDIEVGLFRRAEVLLQRAGYDATAAGATNSSSKSFPGLANSKTNKTPPARARNSAPASSA